MRTITLQTIEFSQEFIDGYSLNYSIDLPTPSQSQGPYWLQITGWIYSYYREIQSLAIYCNVVPRHPLAIAPLSLRLDVANYIKVGEQTELVFDCMVNTLGLQGEFDLYLVPLFEKHNSDSFKTRPCLHHRKEHWFAKLAIRVADDRIKAAETAMAPIFITSLGRSGSTVLFKLISSSSSVIGYERYPSEARIAAYWLNVMRLTLSPADKLDKNVSEQFLDIFREVGACPFHSDQDYPELASLMQNGMLDKMRRHFREIIEDTYSGLSSKENPRYFVEKSVPGTLTAELANECWGDSKEIILVRDLADWALSIKSFLTRTDGNVLKLGGEMTFIQVLRRLEIDLRIQMDYATNRRDKVLVIRYEDLVRRLPSTLYALSDYLGLDDLDFTALDLDIGFNHRTSSTVATSIGKRDLFLDADEGALVDDYVERFLAGFGYGSGAATV
jgi:hypothetical protein